MTSRKGPVMESPQAKQSHRQQMKSMLCDAIKVLCGNTISYSNCLSIEALIGVTVDDAEVILINVNEFLERQPDGVSQELNDCELEGNLEPVSRFMMTSRGGSHVKTDPIVEQEMFDILSDEVIQIEDEEKKELDDLQATICIKEEDHLNCLIGDGNYGNDVYENSSQLPTDGSFIMDGQQFYANSSAAPGEEYTRDSRSFSGNAKWQTYPTETARGGPSFASRSGRNGAFNCRLCKKTFGTQAVYLRHKRKYHQPIAKTVSESSAFNHPNFAGNNGMQNDDAADENWTTMGASSLGRKNTVLSEEVTNMTVYTCSICGKTIRHQSSFLRHKRQHEGIVYKCDLCGAVISRRDALQVHKRKCAMRVQQMSNC